MKHFNMLLSSDRSKRSWKDRKHGKRKVMYFGNQSESFFFMQLDYRYKANYEQNIIVDV